MIGNDRDATEASVRIVEVGIEMMIMTALNGIEVGMKKDSAVTVPVGRPHT